MEWVSMLRIGFQSSAPELQSYRLKTDPDWAILKLFVLVNSEYYKIACKMVYM